jgi:hypothetical protein
MSFTGDEGTFISLSDAATMTSNYRSANPGSNTILGHFWGKNKIQSLFNQTGCVGLRVYYGINGSGSSSAPELVLVGVDSSGNDILTPTTNPLILDRSTPCPPTCSSSNSLNS